MTHVTATEHSEKVYKNATIMPTASSGMRSNILITSYLIISFALTLADGTTLKSSVDRSEYCSTAKDPCLPRRVFIPLENLVEPDSEGKIVQIHRRIPLHRCSSYFGCCPGLTGHYCNVNTVTEVCLKFDFFKHNGIHLERRYLVVKNHTKCGCTTDLNGENVLVPKKQRMLQNCP
ncbi:uncharacterized protein LOC143198902 isoform X1 [Rhynchophorus ferrugineus]|uniref:uncharacterized protein LOC143198902 isoform X1 n=1 Tax=Rhynchophorus ferrugineus TaxID=354439 RepID=UPI003FCE6270